MPWHLSVSEEARHETGMAAEAPGCEALPATGSAKTQRKTDSGPVEADLSPAVCVRIPAGLLGDLQQAEGRGVAARPRDIHRVGAWRRGPGAQVEGRAPAYSDEVTGEVSRASVASRCEVCQGLQMAARQAVRRAKGPQKRVDAYPGDGTPPHTCQGEVQGETGVGRQVEVLQGPGPQPRCVVRGYSRVPGQDRGSTGGRSLQGWQDGSYSATAEIKVFVSGIPHPGQGPPIRVGRYRVPTYSEKGPQKPTRAAGVDPGQSQRTRSPQETQEHGLGLVVPGVCCEQE